MCGKNWPKLLLPRVYNDLCNYLLCNTKDSSPYNYSWWMSNFWIVRFLKTESNPNFGFLHIPTICVCVCWNFCAYIHLFYLLVSWAWLDWPLTRLTNHSFSVLEHCWLGHVTRKIVSEVTYNVPSWTLNPTIPLRHSWHSVGQPS